MGQGVEENQYMEQPLMVSTDKNNLHCCVMGFSMIAECS